MGRIFWGSLPAVVLMTACSAVAAPLDDTAARIAAIERENALLRKENVSLREQSQLRRENARLREQNRAQVPQPATAAPAPIRPVVVVPTPPSAAAPAALPSVILDAATPSAYAPDTLPLKAPPWPVKGDFKFFAEGGAFWTGGEPARTVSYPIETPTTSDRQLDLGPHNAGWEGAAGFDYRFAASPWHVSAQFRYGQVGYTASDSFSFGPTILNNSPTCPFALCLFSSSTQATASNTEHHWLADFAVGHDLSSGPDAMQVKLGMRVVELSSAISQTTTRTIHEQPAFIFGPLTFIDATDTTAVAQNTIFRGAGPRVGVDGAIPLPAGFQVDYQAGAAALFGTRRFEQEVDDFATVTSTVPPAGTVSASQQSSATDHRVTAVGNVDLQVGLAYWVMPNFKVSASYRLDAYFGALETLDVAGNQQLIDRLYHTALITGAVKL
jgi:Legionella pneumophila major outer membrane protein precursor